MIEQNTNTIHYSSLIVGAIIGFIISILKDFINNYMKQKNAQQELKRIKLEEAFILLNNLFTKSMIPAKLQKINNDSAKLTMIIRFYFPNIEKDLKKFIISYTKILETHRENMNKQDVYIPNNFQEFSLEYQTFSKILVDESKKLI